jgi:ribosomal protein S18 acetylase RimI-like enzyme
MTIEDYEEVYALWKSIEGFALLSLDDSKESIEVFLRRNTGVSMVVEIEDEIIGSILCGHDGRRAHFYHVCVKKEFRKQGIGERMVRAALNILRQEGITKVSLVSFIRNEVGNRFWKGLGWEPRTDINWYDCTLNPENVTVINKKA